MYKVKTLNKISKEGLKTLGDKYEIIEDESEKVCDVILVRSQKLHEMEFPKELKAIGRAGAGVNNIPLERCGDEGIVVFNSPGANANAVKELVISGLLLSSRDIIGGVNWAKNISNESDIGKEVEKGKSQFKGPELKGKTIGIIGLGAIGLLVANLCCALDMEVLGYDPYLSVNAAIKLDSRVKLTNKFDELCKKSDYITIHVPFMDSTKGMLNKKAFDNMKDGVRIMNFARGELVNNEDLKAAINSEKVAKYVTDFPDAEVLDMKNTICYPHIGASTPESEVNCAKMVISEIKEYLENGNIINSVNYPNCIMEEFNGVKRIGINYKDNDDVINKITSVLNENDVKIGDMTNKVRGNYGYAIIDTNADISDNVLEKLNSVSGVIKVRLIK